MEVELLDITTREQFRQWLAANHDSAPDCWVRCKRGATPPQEGLWYLDAVEEALCFGWIDATVKTVNGIYCQRFTRRRKGSNWTELNKERCRRLEKLGLMTDAGRAVLPDMAAEPELPKHILDTFRANETAWANFLSFHSLYRRVRIDNIISRTARKVWQSRLEKLIEASEHGEMIGAWNDYGRLLDY